MGDTIWEWRACLLAGLAGRRRCNCSLQPVVLTYKRYQCMRTETSSDQCWDKGLDGVEDLAALVGHGLKALGSSLLHYASLGIAIPSACHGRLCHIGDALHAQGPDSLRQMPVLCG